MEYIITVNDPNDWTTLWDEMTVDGLGDNFIPTHAVTVLNERPFNDFSAHFDLTDAEAEQLRLDPRILAVEIPVEQDPRFIVGFAAQRPGDYNRHPSSTTATMKNWGLLRCINKDDPFGTASSRQTNFNYNLDGTGVDIIVVDTGVEPDHPEFAVNADGSGGSRVVDFNWHSLGVPGIPTAATIGGYLGDVDGHGSNCASIAAGNTCGWASGAKIYSIRINLGAGTTNFKTGQTQGFIPITLVVDLVKAFHLSKPTVGRRPTVCTNSWGIFIAYVGSLAGTMVSTTFRGASYPTTSRNIDYGQVGEGNQVRHGGRRDDINTAVDDCAAAGVILIGAAGNNSHKIDVPGGQDYNNHWFGAAQGTDFPIFYHRGASPTSAPSMICVGATTTILSSSVEQKARYSETGPRVDVYAPGTMIMGAYANKPVNTPAVPDPRRSGFYLNKLSGTSMACPQVAGVVACLLQARPTATTADIKTFITDNSNKDKLTQGTEAWANLRHLHGGANNYLYMPFNNPSRGSITS